MGEPQLTHQGLRVLKAFVENPSKPMTGSALMNTTGLSSGTLYPMLIRFESHDLLESEWERETPQELGRPQRRFYRLTDNGRAIAHRTLADLAIPATTLSPMPSEA